MTKAKHSVRPVPEFASIEDEAEFWDTHDITDYAANLKRVEGNIRVKSVYILEIEGELFTDLMTEAAAENVAPGDLARRMIAEGLESRGQRRRAS